MFNRSEIFKAAWTEKKRRTFGTFGYWLGQAWFRAKLLVKAAAERAAKVAPAPLPAPVLIDPTSAPRVAAIDAELECIQYSDAFAIPVAGRLLDLRAERARLFA